MTPARASLDAGLHSAAELSNVAALVEAIAECTAELLLPRVLVALGGQATTEQAIPLVDAATLAEVLGVTRTFVYEHAGALGAQRLGDGPRARLRFDISTARGGLARCRSERSQPADVPTITGRTPRRQRARSARLPDRLPVAGSILTSRDARAA